MLSAEPDSRTPPLFAISAPALVTPVELLNIVPLPKVFRVKGSTLRLAEDEMCVDVAQLLSAQQ